MTLFLAQLCGSQLSYLALLGVCFTGCACVMSWHSICAKVPVLWRYRGPVTTAIILAVLFVLLPTDAHAYVPLDCAFWRGVPDTPCWWLWLHGCSCS